MTFYDSSCKPAFAALFFRRGSDDSPPHPPGADHTPRARGAGGLAAGEGKKSEG